MKRICLIVSRIKVGLSQKELAEKIGVSQQTIQKWENGTASPKTFSLMKIVESILGISKEALFHDIFGKEGCIGCGNCSNGGGSCKTTENQQVERVRDGEARRHPSLHSRSNNTFSA